MLDAGMQARLQRIIGQPTRLQKWRVGAIGAAIVLTVAVMTYLVGRMFGPPLVITDQTMSEAVALATCQGQSPSEVYLEAMREAGGDAGSWLAQQQMIAFLIERAGRGDCGVAKGNGVDRELVRSLPGEVDGEVLP